MDCWVIRKVFHKHVEEGKIFLSKQDDSGRDLHNRPFPHHNVGVVVLEGDVQLDTPVEEEEIPDTPPAQGCITEKGMLVRGLMKTRGMSHTIRTTGARR